MKVTTEEYYLAVEREPGDPKFYDSRSSRGSAESRLLYHVKKKLNSMGYDFIKKRMWKDGHLTDEDQHYIRARKLPVKPGEIYAIYFSAYMLRSAAEDYNAGGVTYRIERM